MVQDNRESGENPERSRRCVSEVFVEHETCPFVRNYKICDVQILIKQASLGVFLWYKNGVYAMYRLEK